MAGNFTFEKKQGKINSPGKTIGAFSTLNP